MRRLSAVSRSLGTISTLTIAAPTPGPGTTIPVAAALLLRRFPLRFGRVNPIADIVVGQLLRPVIRQVGGRDPDMHVPPPQTQNALAALIDDFNLHLMEFDAQFV